MGSDDNRKRNSGGRLSPDTGKRTPRRLKKQKLTADVGGAGSLAPEQTTGEKKKKRRINSDFIKPADIVRVKGSPDMVIVLLVVILTLFGLVMVFSASYAYAYSSLGNSYFYVRRQAIYAMPGAVLMILASLIDYNFYRRMTPLAYIGTMVLLAGVLAYGFAAGDTQRWIEIGGYSVQPSEMAKLAIVMMIALYASVNQERIVNYENKRQSYIYGLVVPLGIVGLPCILVFFENHFSGVIILFAIGIVMVFASGGNWRPLAVVAVAGVVLVLFAVMFVDYARVRIDMWLNPDNYDPQGRIWQTLQGLNAVGSGGMFGVGIGASKQKYLFVSQPQNDFIFAIICEEMGFVGATIIISLFVILTYRGFRVAMRAPDTYSSLVAFGITAKLALQVILNIAVVTNTIPNTGIALPFFSYGGSALIMQLVEMGMLISISRYTYREVSVPAAVG
jgi:cell division protein FtsW